MVCSWDKPADLEIAESSDAVPLKGPPEKRLCQLSGMAPKTLWGLFDQSEPLKLFSW